MPLPYFGIEGRNRTAGEIPGSEPTAAGGRGREANEWPRSADDAAAPSARNMPGTATGQRHQIVNPR